MPYTINKIKDKRQEYCPNGHPLRIVKNCTVNETVCNNKECNRYISYEKSYYCFRCDFDLCCDCIEKNRSSNGPEIYEEEIPNICESCGSNLGIDKKNKLKLCGGKFCLNTEIKFISF